MLACHRVALGACSSREERAQRYYQSGVSYLEKQDYVKARVELRNALQLKPDTIEAWRALVKVDEHDQNLPGLVGDLLKITELDDKDIDTRVRLATLYLGAGALNDALKTSNAAVDTTTQKIYRRLGSKRRHSLGSKMSMEPLKPPKRPLRSILATSVRGLFSHQSNSYREMPTPD